MALVDEDSATLLRKFNEARDNLRVCPHGCQARKCPQLLDASNLSYIRIWSEPAFAEDLTLAQAQPAFGLAPLAPAISRGFLAPTEPPALPLPIPFAAIISGRRIDGLPEYQTIFPSCATCVFCFELRPIQGIVYKAVSLRCHGKSMTMSEFLRTVVTTIFFSIRDVLPHLSNIEACRMILRINLRDMVTLGQSGSTVYVHVS